MNYETAKKLKDAGFPHGMETFYQEDYKLNFGFDEEADEKFTIDNWDRWSKSFVPTLAELIDACESELDEMVIYINQEETHLEGANPTYGYDIKVSGSNPIDAVAKCYLALQDKI